MKKNNGFTIIEFMISILLATIVLAGALTLYTSTLKSNSDAVKLQRFEQVMQVLQNAMITEIRRAGYANAGIALTPQSNGLYFYIPNTNTCILFSHATPTTNEVFYGFQISNNQVYYYTSTTTNGSCANLTNWTQVTDSNQVKVDTLTFTLAPTGTMVNIHLVMEAVGLTLQNGNVVKRDSSTSVHIRNA